MTREEISEKIKERFTDVVDRLNIKLNCGSNLACSTDTLKNWMSGYCVPSMKSLFAFCEIYNVSANYLLGLTDEYKSAEMGNFTLAKERLVKVLEESKYTMSDIGRMLGTSSGQVNLWRNLTTLPKADSLGTVCSKFNVSADWLFGFSEERTLNLNEDMYVEKVTCPVCGDVFTRTDRMQLYCTRYCKNKDLRGKRTQKTKVKRSMTISQISKLAREEGLTYGQYVLRMNIERERRFK